jgi:hypothetical protein
LIEICEKRCEGYGDDYKQMCEKIAHSVVRYPVGRESTVLVNGRVAGSASVTTTESVVEEDCKVTDEALPAFPQLFGPLHDLALALYPDIPYEYKIMAAFTHYGLLRSGLDVLDTDPNLQSRLYCCLIGDPQRGKSAALNEIRKVFQQLTTRYNCITSVDSGPALVDEFSDRHKAAILQDDKLARVLIDCDEMKGLFEKSKVTTQSRNSMFDEFLKLYESNRTGNRSRKAGKTHVDDAHLAILGGATPEGYQTMWTGSAGGSTGLQSRFIGVSTTAPRMPIERRQCSDNLGSIIVKLYDQMAKPKRIVSMEWDAIAELTEWWQDVPTDNPATNRVDDMVKRLCLIMASSLESDVTYDMMKVAIKAGKYFIAFREKYNPPDSSSYIHALENEILKIALKNEGKSLSANQFRKAIRPERRAGGLGAFLVAWRNVIGSGMLVTNGTNRSNHPKYKLEEN